MNPNQPNILLITTDQQRWDTIGDYGVTPVRTPHLDALARRGLLLDRAYCANPLCMPSRTSLLTGLYPSRHGAYTNGVRAPETYPDTIAEVLGRLGYATALIGKAHFRPCSDQHSIESPPRVFDTGLYRQWAGPYYGFEHAELAICHSHEAPACGMHYGVWLQEQGIDTALYWGRPDQEYTTIGPWNVPESAHNSRWVADRSMALMDRAAGVGNPFFLWASFQDPHNPIVVPEPWYALHDRDAMPDYTLRAGEMADKPPFYQEFLNTAEYEQGRIAGRDLFGVPCVGRQLTRGRPHRFDHPGMEQAANRRNAVAAYYGMVSLLDHHIGRMLAHLEARGLLDQTLIVFTSDHGDYLGNHGLWWKGLPAYEDCQRVPMLVCRPGAIEGGRRSSALQSLVDLAPTLVAAAGGRPPAGWQGVNQWPVWQGQRPAARDWARIEFRPADSDYCQHTLITADRKLVAYAGRDYGELYDLETDPDQFYNRWNDPGWQAGKQKLLDCLETQVAGGETGPRRPRIAPA